MAEMKLRVAFSGLVAATAIAAATGCGGDDPAQGCGEGESCPCETNLDCPNPLTERCDVLVEGFEGTCVAIGGTDAGDAGPDAAPDAPLDAPDESTPDVRDSGREVAEEVDADEPDEPAPDVAPDVTPEVGPDVADVAPDVAPDETDADEPDEPVGPVVYDGWVAYGSERTGELSRVRLQPGDGSSGPFELPGSSAFSWRAQHPAFSADGTSVFYTLVDTAVVVRRVELSTGTVTDLLSGRYSSIQFPSPSPDGRSLAFRAKATSDDAWNVYTASIEGGAVTRVTNVLPSESASRSVSAPAWAPDGSGVYYIASRLGGSASSDLIFHPTGGDAETIVPSVDTTSELPRVHPSGDEVILASGTTFRRWGVRRDGGEIAFGASVEVPVASNTGGVCAYYGDSGRLLCTVLQSASGACATPSGTCLLDVVVTDMAGATLANLTESTDARELTPVVTVQPYTSLPYAGDE